MSAKRVAQCVFLLAFVLAPGCRPDATEVVLHIEADAPSLAVTERVEVRACGPDGNQIFARVVTVSGAQPEANFPLTVPLAPAQEEDGRAFAVEVDAIGASNRVRGSLRAFGRFRTGKRSEHTLRFEAACDGIVCAAGETCRAGTCAAAALAPATSAADGPNVCVSRCEGCDDPCSQCVAGACVPRPNGSACGGDGRCWAGTCCRGCWDGMACREGTGTDACGSGGRSCRTCCGGEPCVNGACSVREFVSDIKVSSGITCAKRSASGSPDEAVAWCWGTNDRGQLGTGSAGPPALRPVPAPKLDDVRLSLGGRFGCGIISGDRLVCWGSNQAGQTGTGSGEQTLVPTPVIDVSGRELPPVSRWSLGASHACAVTRTGELFCWGYNENGSVGVGHTNEVPRATKVELPAAAVAVYAGNYQTCATTADDKLFCWGAATDIRLGINPRMNLLTPTPVPQYEPWLPWRGLALGHFHVCGVRTGGSLLCYGGNANGQLGIGARDDVLAPGRLVVAPGGKPWSQVAAGRRHTCALTERRTPDDRQQLHCWGRNTSGQLGNGSDLSAIETSPVEIAGELDVVSFAADEDRTCAIDKTGTLWCWGEGALGTGDEGPRTRPTRVCF